MADSVTTDRGAAGAATGLCAVFEAAGSGVWAVAGTSVDFAVVARGAIVSGMAASEFSAIVGSDSVCTACTAESIGSLETAAVFCSGTLVQAAISSIKKEML